MMAKGVWLCVLVCMLVRACECVSVVLHCQKWGYGASWLNSAMCLTCVLLMLDVTVHTQTHTWAAGQVLRHDHYFKVQFQKFFFFLELA